MKKSGIYMENRPIPIIFKEIKEKLKKDVVKKPKDKGTYIEWGALKIDKYIWDKFLEDKKIQKELLTLIE